MKRPGGGQALLFEKPTVNGVVSRSGRHQYAGILEPDGAGAWDPSPWTPSPRNWARWSRRSPSDPPRGAAVVVPRTRPPIRASPDGCRAVPARTSFIASTPGDAHRTLAGGSGDFGEFPDAGDCFAHPAQPAILHCWPLDGGRFPHCPAW